jgi:hypothetical protein
MPVKYAKEYATFYATSGLTIEQAYRAIFGSPMPYQRRVLNLRSFFNRGYK